MFKFLTKQFTKIPLLWIEFNLQNYIKHGDKDSCIISLHPTLNDDIQLRMKVMDLVDYIRANYDMEELVK